MNKRYTLFLVLLFVCVIAKTIAQVKTPAIVFIKGIGGDGYDQFVNKYVSSTSDGGFIISINSTSVTGNINTTCSDPTGFSVFQKYNPVGNILEWEKCDQTYSYIVPASNNDWIVGGTEDNFPIDGRNVILKRQTDNGTEIWSKKYGGTGDDQLRGIIATDDGNYIVVSSTYSNDGDVGLHYGSLFTADYWVFKIDPSGNIIWSKVLGGTWEDSFPFIVAAIGGGCYVIGATASNDYDCVGFHGIADVFAARIDGGGNKMWSKCLGGSERDAEVSATLGKDGHVLISASTASDDGDVHHHIGHTDSWVIELDSNGSMIWENCYGTPDTSEYANTICRATDGTIWLAGRNYKQDSWIFRLSETGVLLSEKQMGVQKYDEALISHALPGGLMFIGGRYDGIADAGSEMPHIFGGQYDVYLAAFAPWTTSVVKISADQFGITAYPNPATERVTIRLNGERDYAITVTDVLGRVVYTGTFYGNVTQLDVRNWIAGAYNVEVADNKGEREIARLVVNNGNY